MSTEEFEKYKKDYQDFLNLLIEFHNQHVRFLNLPTGRYVAIDLRHLIKKIQISAKALNHRTKLVNKEALNNRKEYKAQLREEKNNKKGKRNVNNSSTTGTI